MLRRANLSFFVKRDKTAPAAADGPPAREPAEPAEDPLESIRAFNLKPRDIRDYLNRFVIRQDEAKKVLAVALCDHYNHVRRCLADPAAGEVEYAKHNILFLGPTGVGKTYMMRCAARLIGVPFVKADATKFSETGYVGHDVEDLVRDLVKAADGDVDLAQYGIVFMDEIDKIAAQSTAGGKDVSGRGVQINLLKLMEDTDVGLFSQTDIIGQMQAVMTMQRGNEPPRQSVNTRHILFIVSGAFDKLAEQVRQRLQKSQIGFGSGAAGERSEGDCLRQATTRDFMDYGFEPEFIGRLPVRVVFDPLDVADLEAIMKRSEGSVLAQYRADFEGYGLQFRMQDAAIRRVAELAHAEKTGARGLMTVLERMFRDFKFELPSTTIKRFEVTEQTVADVPAALAAALKQEERAHRAALEADLRAYAVSFEAAHGIRLTFAKEAREALVDLCLAGHRTVAEVSGERFRDFEYALKLIARNTGRNRFAVTRKLVESPAEELSRRVAESFNG
ncbi:MAG: AAA family ATPase [Lentisphaerae bacterium]|nr:AAA family ATPase [Lentisphaerota bacterium]